MRKESPFQQGLDEGCIRFQRCAGCGTAQTLMRFACSGCGRNTLEWQEAAGGGCVYTLSLVHRTPLETFSRILPYVLAIVDMDEGFRLMGHCTTRLAIGDRIMAGVGHLEPSVVRFVKAAEVSR